jgi:hypothetical protein
MAPRRNACGAGTSSASVGRLATPLAHSGHGQRKGGTGSDNCKPPKAEDLKIQFSLKTFLANPTENKLTKKDRKQLQALLTTMHQNNDSDAGSVDSN